MTEQAKPRPSPSETMRIRVNPAYDVDVDPQDQEWAYVNPVQLNNDLITIANQMLVLADASAKAIRANQRLRLDKRKLERQLADAEAKLLADDPLAPTEAKNLKSTEAAIRRRVEQLKLHTSHDELRAGIRLKEDQIEENDATIRIAEMYWKTGERVADNIKTHLAYVKDERRRV